VKKIAIVGPGGAGKTHLASRLGQLLGIQVFHLDAYLFKPGWRIITLSDQKKIVAEMVSRPAWIVDGEHLPTQILRFSHADAIVFLDVPLMTRLQQLWRRSRLEDRARADVASGCDADFSLFALKWALLYPILHRGKTLRNLDRFIRTKQVYVLHKRNEVDQFVQQIAGQLNA